MYVIFAREKDVFKLIYVDECEETKENDFFTKNEKFKCWLNAAGSDDLLYLAILPMWESDKAERQRIVDKAIVRYEPICNE